MSHPKFDLDSLPCNFKVEYIFTRVAGRPITTCVIRNDDDEIIGCGSAICHHRDTTNVALGQTIASGRAVKDYWGRGLGLPMVPAFLPGPRHQGFV